MKTLTKILLVGTVFLAGCNGEHKRSKAALTNEDFTKAEWIRVPYSGEIWSSYLEEDVVHGERNWELYKTEVAKKNKFGYIQKDGISYIVKVRGKEILIPDLDGNGYVLVKKDKKTNLIEGTSVIAEEESEVK